MAYASLTNISISDADCDEIFKHMRDFICKRNGTYDYSTTGIGWTLHDAVYAIDEDNISTGDYFVIYSAGESGDERMYFKISVTSDTYLYNEGYTYWNNVTHTGGSVVYKRSSPYAHVRTNADRLFIYGDLNYIQEMVVNTTGGMTSFSFRGCLDTPQYTGRTVQQTTALASAGSGVSITVGDSTDPWWKVGNELIIFDGSNLQQITVLSNDDVDTITADLTYTFQANSSISVIFPYIVDGRTNYTYSNGYFYVIHNGSGTKNQACSRTAFIGTLEALYTQNAWRYCEFWWIFDGDDLIGKVPNTVHVGFDDTTYENAYVDEYGDDWRNFGIICFKESTD